MKNIAAISAFLIGIALTINVTAQNVSPKQIREARQSLYEWIESYKENSVPIHKRQIRKFSKLFESDQTMIEDEYIPRNGYDFQDHKTTVNNYIQIVNAPENLYNLISTIQHLWIEQENYDETGIGYELIMEKTLRFIEKEDGVLDKTRYKNRHEYPPIVVRYAITLRYSFDTKETKATMIKQTSTITPFLVYHHDTINEIKYDNNWLTSQRRSPVVRMIAIPWREDEKMYEPQYDTIGPSFGITIAGGYLYYTPEISDNRFSTFNGNGEQTYAIGLHYFIPFGLWNKGRIGGGVGVSYQHSSIWNSGTFNERYCTTDPDGSAYERIINLTQIQEEISFNTFAIPIFFKGEWFVSNYCSLFGSLGVRGVYDIAQLSSIQSESDYSGYYSDLFNVTLSQNGIYDFGQFHEQTELNRTGINPFRIAYQLALGISYYFDRWSIDVGVLYQQTFISPITRIENFHLSERHDEWQSSSHLINRFSPKAINAFMNINYNF